MDVVSRRPRTKEDDNVTTGFGNPRIGGKRKLQMFRNVSAPSRPAALAGDD